jgi:hypothetical protein
MSLSGSEEYRQMKSTAYKGEIRRRRHMLRMMNSGSMTRRRVSVGAVFLLSTILCVIGYAADWLGNVVVRDGVRYVSNPAEPLNGRRDIALKEAWRISEDSEDIVGLVVDVAEAPDGSIYLLDVQLKTVWVHDRHGRRFGSVGREGDGPGEVRRPFQLLWWSDDRLAIAESFPGRFHLFCNGEEPCGTVPLQVEKESEQQFSVSLQKAQVTGQTMLVEFTHQTFAENKSIQTRRLGTSDLQGRILNTILERYKEQDMSKATHRREEDATWVDDRWAVGTNGVVYVADAHRGYAINAFSLDGARSMVVSREYECVVRSKEEREESARPYERISRSWPNLTYEISDYHMDIVGLRAMRDGTIWVQSSEGKWRLPGGAIAGYDVFDADGRYVEQVTLFAPGDPVDDLIVLLDERVVVVPGFWSLAYALGGNADLVQPDDGESSDAMVVCYEF